VGAPSDIIVFSHNKSALAYLSDGQPQNNFVSAINYGWAGRLGPRVGFWPGFDSMDSAGSQPSRPSGGRRMERFTFALVVVSFVNAVVRASICVRFLRK
jgi:hypothetical protein